MTTRDELVVDQRTLARVFDVDVRTVQRWEAQGLAAARVNGRPLYDLPAAVAWRIELERARAERPGDIRDTYEEARTRREMARAKLAEMEVAEAEGQLIRREVVEQVYGRMLDVLRSAVLNMPGRWGAQIVGLESPRAGSAALRRVSAELLETLSGDVADELEASGSAELPEDFPGRDALAAAGIRTVAELLDVEELESIRGIGRVTAERIRRAIGGRGAA